MNEQVVRIGKEMKLGQVVPEGCDQSTPAIFREKEAPTRRFG
jgi:hypothetical protein